MSEVGHVRNALEAFTSRKNAVFRHTRDVRELGIVGWLSAGGYVIVKEDDFNTLIERADKHADYAVDDIV